MILLQMPMEKNYCAHFVVYDYCNIIYVLLTSDAEISCILFNNFFGNFLCWRWKECVQTSTGKVH